MSKKIIISLIASLAILLGFVQYNSYAKYILSDAIGMSVYIDKTAPIIQIESNHNNGSYDKTNINDIIKNNCEITLKILIIFQHKSLKQEKNLLMMDTIK